MKYTAPRTFQGFVRFLSNSYSKLDPQGGDGVEMHECTYSESTKWSHPVVMYTMLCVVHPGR